MRAAFKKRNSSESHAEEGALVHTNERQSAEAVLCWGPAALQRPPPAGSRLGNLSAARVGPPRQQNPRSPGLSPLGATLLPPPRRCMHARSHRAPFFFVRAAPVNVTTSGASPSTSRGTPPLRCATPLPRHRPPPPRARPDGGPAVDTLLPRGTVDHPELASTPPPRRPALPTPPRPGLHNSVAVSAAAPCSPTLRPCLARALLVETAARGA